MSFKKTNDCKLISVHDPKSGKTTRVCTGCKKSSEVTMTKEAFVHGAVRGKCPYCDQPFQE